MTEPPPVVEYPPEPSKAGNPIWSAFGTLAVLIAVLLLISNIVSVPFIVVGVANYFSKGGSLRQDAEAVVTPKLSEISASRVQQGLASRLPGHIVTITGRGSGTVIKIHAERGNADPVRYQEALDSTLVSEHESASATKFSTGRPDLSLDNLMTDPVILVGSGISIQLAIMLVWLVGRKIYFKGDRALPPFHSGALWKAILVGACCAVPIALLADFADSGLRVLFQLKSDSIWDAVNTFPAWGTACVLVMGVVGAPIFEELFFRGIVIGLFTKAGKPWLGVAVSATCFGIAHLQDVATVLSITLMGLILGFVYLKTKSLYSTIVIHMINNAISFGLLLNLGHR